MLGINSRPSTAVPADVDVNLMAIKQAELKLSLSVEDLSKFSSAMQNSSPNIPGLRNPQSDNPLDVKELLEKLLAQLTHSDSMDELQLRELMAGLLSMTSEDKVEKNKEKVSADMSASNSWLNRMTAILDQMVQLLLLLSRTDARLKSDNTALQLAGVFNSAELSVAAAKDGMAAAISSAVVGGTVALAGTAKTLQGTKRHMATESELTSSNKKLKTDMQSNKGLINEKDAQLHQLSSQDMAKKRTDLEGDLSKLRADKEQLKTQLQEIDNQLALAPVQDNDPYLLQQRRRDVDEKLLAIENKIDEKTSDLEALSDEQRFRRISELKAEINQLALENEKLGGTLDENAHALNRSRNELERLQSIAQFILQMSRPASTLAEESGRLGAARKNADSSITSKNAEVFGQVSANKDDNKRKTDAMRDMMIRALVDMMLANISTQSSVIGNLLRS